MHTHLDANVHHHQDLPGVSIEVGMYLAETPVLHLVVNLHADLVEEPVTSK